MMHKQKKIWIIRGVWFGILLLNILLPTIISAVRPSIKLIDDECLTTYNDFENNSTCEISLTFNVEISSGYAYIYFYDSNENLIYSKNVYLSSYAKVAEKTIYNIPGEVHFYELGEISVDYVFSVFFDFIDFIYVLIPLTLSLFIISLTLLSYKVYEYNGKIISVYAGFSKHWLKVDDEIYDEYNTAFSITPIKLSCVLEDESSIEATISTSNKITLKINNKLYNKMKSYKKI